MTLSSEAVDANYRRLGFSCSDLGMKLKVGCVELSAVYYPLGGIARFFTGVRPDTAAQIEIHLPVFCLPDLIAGMTYANIARTVPEDAQVLAQTIADLRGGKMDPRVASAITPGVYFSMPRTSPICIAGWSAWSRITQTAEPAKPGRLANPRRKEAHLLRMDRRALRAA